MMENLNKTQTFNHMKYMQCALMSCTHIMSRMVPGLIRVTELDGMITGQAPAKSKVKLY
jgi:hypothetical protein